MATIISFGPDYPPDDSGTAGSVMRRALATFGVKRDALDVAEEPEEVSLQLATAGGQGSWPEFTEQLPNGTRRVWVNPALVRFVGEARGTTTAEAEAPSEGEGS